MSFRTLEEDFEEFLTQARHLEPSAELVQMMRRVYFCGAYVVFAALKTRQDPGSVEVLRDPLGDVAEGVIRNLLSHHLHVTPDETATTLAKLGAGHAMIIFRQGEAEDVLNASYQTLQALPEFIKKRGVH